MFFMENANYEAMRILIYNTLRDGYLERRTLEEEKQIKVTLLIRLTEHDFEIDFKCSSKYKGRLENKV